MNCVLKKKKNKKQKQKQPKTKQNNTELNLKFLLVITEARHVSVSEEAGF